RPVDFFPIEEIRFPDGEYKLRLTDGFVGTDDKQKPMYKNPDNLVQRLRDGEKVLLVLRGKAGSEWDPEGVFVRTLFALEALHTYGSKQDDICVMYSYYPFSRQHETYRLGEVNSAKRVRKAIKDELSRMMITISAHNYRQEGEMDNRAWNMDATESVIEYLRDIPMGAERYVVTPDSGQYSGKLRFPLANALSAGTIAFGKERDVLRGDIDVDVRNLDGLKHPEDVDVILYDDELATGGTLRSDIDMCIAHGVRPERIHAVTIHNKDAFNAKHNKRAVELVTETGARFSASDTIESQHAAYSVVPQAARFVRKMFW
ncbi:MAG: hypothetical protein ABIG30_03100, partial [Candidatus Aenigmatarchaeota archaeon]